jgi:hypothetical protein
MSMGGGLMARILGLSIAGGDLYLGLIETSSESGPFAAAGGPERLQPASLQPDERLADFASRFGQILRECQPDRVVLVATRKHSSWSYREAEDRILLVAAVMLQCRAHGIPFQEMKTEAIGRAVSLPAKSLSEFDHGQIRAVTRPAYWSKGRASAFAAAVACL